MLHILIDAPIPSCRHKTFKLPLGLACQAEHQHGAKGVGAEAGIDAFLQKTCVPQ